VLANKIFKNLKSSLEGMKDVIQKIEERKMHQNEIFDLNKQILMKQQKANSEKLRVMTQHVV